MSIPPIANGLPPRASELNENRYEIEAFARLTDAGASPEAIGARFGVSANRVIRRLKLTRVSPRVIEALDEAQDGAEIETIEEAMRWRGRAGRQRKSRLLARGS